MFREGFESTVASRYATRSKDGYAHKLQNISLCAVGA